MYEYALPPPATSLQLWFYPSYFVRTHGFSCLFPHNLNLPPPIKHRFLHLPSYSFVLLPPPLILLPLLRLPWFPLFHFLPCILTLREGNFLERKYSHKFCYLNICRKRWERGTLLLIRAPIYKDDISVYSPPRLFPLFSFSLYLLSPPSLLPRVH